MPNDSKARDLGVIPLSGGTSNFAMHALLVGVTEFQSGVRPLPFVKEDLDSFKDSLIALGFSREKIAVLGPGGTVPTWEAVHTALSDLSLRLEHETLPSQVIVYVATHGAPMESGGATFLLWQNTVIPPQKYLSNGTLRAIPDKASLADDLIQRVQQLKAVQKLVLFDACFAGAARRSADRGTRTIAPNHADSYRRQQVTHVIAAGSTTEYAQECERAKQGLFTYHLKEELNRFIGRGAGVMNASILASIVSNRVSLDYEAIRPQSPHCWIAAGEGEFVFVHPRGPGSEDLASLMEEEDRRIGQFVLARLAASDARLAEKDRRWRDAAEYWDAAALLDPQTDNYKKRRATALEFDRKERSLELVRKKIDEYILQAKDCLQSGSSLTDRIRAAEIVKSALDLLREHHLHTPGGLTALVEELGRRQASEDLLERCGGISRLVQDGRLEEALAAIQAALSSNAGSMRTWLRVQQGLIHSQLERRREAEADMAMGAIHNAIVLERWDRVDEVLYQSASCLLPQSAQFVGRVAAWRVLFERGNVRAAILSEAQNDFEAALEFWRKALKEAQDYPGLKMRLDSCRDRLPKVEFKFVKNGMDGLTYVRVEKGEFFAGPVPGDGNVRPEEGSRRLVQIDIPFWISVTPVTVRAFHKVMHGSYNGAGALEPMRNLSHAEAVRYCETAGKNLGGVLPTQEQWEMAARAGSDGNVYPWDHYAGPKKAWYDKKSSPCPVGYSGKNAAGVEDIAGNVWEWCADEAEFVRGGAYDSPTADLRISARKKKNPEIGYADVGFRCVLATEPTPS